MTTFFWNIDAVETLGEKQTISWVLVAESETGERSYVYGAVAAEPSAETEVAALVAVVKEQLGGDVVALHKEVLVSDLASKEASGAVVSLLRGFDHTVAEV